MLPTSTVLRARLTDSNAPAACPQVDMLTGVVVTAGVWSWFQGVYPPATRQVRPRKPGSPPDPLHPLVLALIGACLVVAAIIVIGGNA